MEGLRVDPTGIQRPAPQPLPLRFTTPPGWPEASPDWQAGHLGWAPPRGWVPLAGLRSAPRGWRWWQPDPAGWSLEVRRDRARRARVIALAVTAIAVGLALIAFAPLDQPAWRILAWGLLGAAPVELARSLHETIGSRRHLTRLLAARYAGVGLSLDRRAHAEHVASAGSDPLDFDSFVHRRAVQSWSFDGAWPADQTHDLTDDDFRIRADGPCLGRRLLLIALSGLAAVALIYVLAWSIDSAMHTRGDEVAAIAVALADLAPIPL